MITLIFMQSGAHGYTAKKTGAANLDFMNIYAPFKNKYQDSNILVSDMQSRQGLRRPPSFVTWLFNGNSLIISTVFTLIESGVRDAGLLMNVLDDNGCSDLTTEFQGWIAQTLSGSVSYGGGLSANILRQYTEDFLDKAYYGSFPEENSLVMVNKFGYVFDSNLPYSPGEVGSLVYDFALNIGLGEYIYQDWEPSNDQQLPPGGWRREQRSKNTFYYEPAGGYVNSVSGVAHTKIDGSEQEKFGTVSIDEWKYVLDDTELSQLKDSNNNYRRKRTGEVGWCGVGTNPWDFYTDATPYISTSCDTECLNTLWP